MSYSKTLLEQPIPLRIKHTELPKVKVLWKNRRNRTKTTCRMPSLLSVLRRDWGLMLGGMSTWRLNSRLTDLLPPNSHINQIFTLARGFPFTQKRHLRVLGGPQGIVNPKDSAYFRTTVVRRVGAPYRRVRIPGSSDLCACEVSANEDIALWIRCVHLMIQQAIHWLFHALF